MILFFLSLYAFYNSQVAAFCDVDPKKIKCGAYIYHESKVSINYKKKKKTRTYIV